MRIAAVLAGASLAAPLAACAVVSDRAGEGAFLAVESRPGDAERPAGRAHGAFDANARRVFTR